MDGDPGSSPGSKFQPNKLQVALHWLSIGVSPLPIIAGTKRPSVEWLLYQRCLPAESVVRAWFRFGSSCELAIICGGPAGLVVLDFDTRETFHAWRASCDIVTYTVETVRGRHAYFFTDDPRSFDHPLCEVRGPGRYVLTVPSRHPSGAFYRTFDGAPIAHVSTLSEVLPAYTTPIPGGQTTLPSTAGPVADVKARLNLLDVAREVVELRSSDGGRGRWFAGQCPFHDDRHPSLWIDAERGRFGCRAPACAAHRSGDVLDFLALSRGVTVRDVIGGAL